MSPRHRKPSLLSAPGAPAVLASSILARLPLAMFSIALLVHARQLTGSFALAGVVSGAYAISSAISAPVLGRLVDRCGQTGVLVGTSIVTTAALVVTGSLAPGVDAGLLIGLAALVGLATPPLDACVYALLPAIASEPDGLPTLFAFESTLLELTFVAGPPLALGLGVLWSSGAALAVSGLIMLAGALAFAAQPASRRWRPQPGARRPGGGSLRSPAVRTLALVLLGTGVVFGATEVGVTAAARALGSAGAAGPLLAVWGLGSLVGGAIATRLRGSTRHAHGLKLLLGALAIGHGALIVVAGNLFAIGAVITLAGATIAPTEAAIYAMVDRAAAATVRAEAFSWLLAASLSGAALGAGSAGIAVQRAGAPAAFGVAAAAGALALVAAALGTRSLDDATSTHRDDALAAIAGCSADATA